jgi:hypothetical protein
VRADAGSAAATASKGLLGFASTGLRQVIGSPLAGAASGLTLLGGVLASWRGGSGGGGGGAEGTGAATGAPWGIMSSSDGVVLMTVTEGEMQARALSSSHWALL